MCSGLTKFYRRFQPSEILLTSVLIFAAAIQYEYRTITKVVVEMVFLVH